MTDNTQGAEVGAVKQTQDETGTSLGGDVQDVNAILKFNEDLKKDLAGKDKKIAELMERENARVQERQEAEFAKKTLEEQIAELKQREKQREELAKTRSYFKEFGLNPDDFNNIGVAKRETIEQIAKVINSSQSMALEKFKAERLAEVDVTPPKSNTPPVDPEQEEKQRLKEEQLRNAGVK